MENNTRFSDKILKDKTIIEDSLSSRKYFEKDTQDFFEEYFKGKPQLTNLHIDRQQGIDVLFRRNDEGRIYGATFIDHTTRSVLNGSHLDK